MTLPVSPEILLAMLRQERLQHLAARAEADDKIRTLDAQISGAAAVMEINTRVGEAEAASAYTTAQADGAAADFAESLIDKTED